MRRSLVGPIVLVIIIAVIFWSSYSLQSYFFATADALEQYMQAHHAIGVGVFVGLAAVSAILSPFSSTVLLPFAVAIWGLTLSILLLTLGWLLGGLAAYAIGIYAAYPLLRGFLPVKKIQRYEQQLPRGKQFWIVLLFRLALPSELGSYFLGIIRYPFWKYFTVTLVSEFVFAVIVISIAGAIIERQPLLFILWIAAAVGVTFVAFALYQRANHKLVVPRRASRKLQR